MPDNNKKSPLLQALTGGFIGAGMTVAGNLLNTGLAQHVQNRQNRYNEQQLRKQLIYDSPAEQMKRLIAAGISPAAAAQSLAPSTQGSPLTSAAPAANQNMFESVTNNAMLMTMMNRQQRAQADLTEEQATAMHIENKTKERLTQRNLESLEAQIEATIESTKMNKKQREQFERTADNLFNMSTLQLEQLKTQIESTKFDNKYKSWKNNFMERTGLDPGTSNTFGVLAQMIVSDSKMKDNISNLINSIINKKSKPFSGFRLFK